jgi:hypothetical protein
MQSNMIQKNLQKGDFVLKRGEEGNEILLEEGKVDISVGNIQFCRCNLVRCE